MNFDNPTIENFFAGKNHTKFRLIKELIHGAKNN